MKPLQLLPYRWKRVGIITSIVAFAFTFLLISNTYHIPWLRVKVHKHNNYSPDFEDLNNELALSILIIGLLLMIYSCEKTETEGIQIARFHAFQWAVLVNSVLIFVAGWLLYSHSFMLFMLCNLILTLVLYLFRFYYLLHRLKRTKKKNFVE